MSSDLESLHEATVQLRITRDDSEGRPRVLVSAAGEVDLSTARQLHDALVDAGSRRGAAVQVDLGRLDFMDSSGVHALLDGRSEAERSGGSLTLVAMSPAVARVLGVLGLTELLTSGAAPPR